MQPVNIWTEFEKSPAFPRNPSVSTNGVRGIPTLSKLAAHIHKHNLSFLIKRICNHPRAAATAIQQKYKRISIDDSTTGVYGKTVFHTQLSDKE